MIKWEGKGMPDLPPETRVLVRTRSGRSLSAEMQNFVWKHVGALGDIVAYEVVDGQPAGDTQDTGSMLDDSQRRKNRPIVRGCLDYFPDALLAVSELSRIANDKHNPGQPMHWSKGKSNDHADCAVRHLIERGKWDTTMAEPVRHSTAAAWRALANLQTEIELDREKAAA